MLQGNNTQDKFKLSTRVKKILFEKGFSFLFNWQDYKIFKKECENDFNPAYSIVYKFLQQAERESDFKDYIF